MSLNIYAIDTETTGLNFWGDDVPFSIQCCNERGDVFFALRRGAAGPRNARADRLYAPLTGSTPLPVGGQPLVSTVRSAVFERVDGQDWEVESNIEELQTMRAFVKMLRDPNAEKVYHNAKFDVRMLENLGIPPAGLPHDTMILARLIFPDVRSVALKSLARWLLKVDTKSETILKEWMSKNQVESYSDIPIDILQSYAIDDVLYTMALYRGLINKLPDSMKQLYTNERYLTDLVGRMEKRGMVCDIDYAKRMSQHCKQEQVVIYNQITEMSGEEVNPNSPKQLNRVLFDILRIQDTIDPGVISKYRKLMFTPTGTFSTKREALKKYEHPIIQLIMDYRMFGKMAGGYFDKFPELVDGNGVLHPSFQQCGTITGRFSCRNPSFQTIPSVTSGRLIDFDIRKIPNVRRCFTTREGYNMYAPDYSQIELRIASIYAGERVMQDAFIHGRDIHDDTTKAIFPDDWWDPSDRTKIDKPKRTFCKMVNFGTIYGMGVGKLSGELDVPFDRAKEFLERYFRTYPGMRELMSNCQRQVVTQGFVESVLGRRFVTIPQKAYRATNYLIQGTAADVLKMTMIRMDMLFDQMGVDAHILNTVHDEIIFEVRKEDDTVELHKRLKEVMEDWPEFAPVPLKVNCKKVIGYWGNHEEVW